MATSSRGTRRVPTGRDAVEQHAWAAARLALELWAVRVVALADTDGTVRGATLAVSDQPEYEQMMLDALSLPSPWASLDLINAALCAFVHEQGVLLETGGAHVLDAGVLRALGAGGHPSTVEELGVDVVTISVVHARDEMRVALALGPRRADGSRVLTREFGFPTGGAPQGAGEVLRRQGARVLWYSLGGQAMGEPEPIPDPAAFIARVQRDGVCIDRRFRSEPDLRRLLLGDGP